MKKMISLFVTTVFLASSFVIPVSANENSEIITTGTVNIDNIDDENSNVSVSDPMTFTEMVTHYAKTTGISYEEALAAFPNESTRATRTASHRVLSVTLNVTGSYKPHLDFYCNTSEGGNFWGITSIYSVQLVRNYGNESKQFAGTVDMWLRSGYEIEYVVNGDFYNNGTTTASGGTGLSVGVGGSANISFQASIAHSSNHYKYFYDHQTVAFQH